MAKTSTGTEILLQSALLEAECFNRDTIEVCSGLQPEYKTSEFPPNSVLLLLLAFTS